MGIKRQISFEKFRNVSLKNIRHVESLHENNNSEGINAFRCRPEHTTFSNTQKPNSIIIQFIPIPSIQNIHLLAFQSP